MSDIREAFPKGCRVRLNAMGKTQLLCMKKDDRLGIVMGHSRDREGLRILWDGLRTPQAWHRDYVERVDA